MRKRISILIMSVLIACLLTACGGTAVRRITINGTAMSPTLNHGDVAQYAPVKEYSRGDIVICRFPDRGDVLFCKRIVAVPGDCVYREEGITYVRYTENGQMIDVALDDPEEYGNRSPFSSPEYDYPPYEMIGTFFVVGDNRMYSHDSRDWNDGDSYLDVGPIPEKLIEGKVVAYTAFVQ